MTPTTSLTPHDSHVDIELTLSDAGLLVIDSNQCHDWPIGADKSNPHPPPNERQGMVSKE